MNTLTIITATLALAGAQDTPQDIPKKELPKKAECVVCSAGGEAHGAEKAVAGVRYKGKRFFFCNAKEITEFKKDPDAYLPPVLPRPMPAFALSDLSGKAWDAKAFEGRLVLVDFWATWCKPCLAIKPRLDTLRAKHAPQGFEVLSVSIDEKRPDLDKYLKKHRYANPVLHDTKQTWSAWRVRSIPALFLVKDGQVVAQWSGIPKKGEIEAAVEASLVR